jgi:hypothetical protein
MDPVLKLYINNLAFILMWVGAWSLIDIAVFNFFKKHRVAVYFWLFVIGSVLVVVDNYY